MQIDLTTLPLRDSYQWLTHSIMPRPIAWVSTISTEGRTNLAPFSFFQGVTGHPPSLLFVPVNDRHGFAKDTLKNIQQVPEFVVNLVPNALAETMNATSAELPYGESEFETFGVQSAASVVVRPPRVAGAPVSFECVLHQIVPVGEGAIAANIVIGLIKMAHADDSVMGANGFPDPAKMDLIGRMGGDSYARTRERFDLRRPKAKGQRLKAKG
ncbi:MAG TPA: flavin reductase family protein [Opitutaceae bacterium]